MKARLGKALTVMVLVAMAAGAAAGEVRLDRDWGRELLEGSGRVDSARFLPPEDDKRPTDEELPVPWGWYLGPVFQLISTNMSALDPMTGDRRLDSFSNQMFLYGLTVGAIHGNLRAGLALLFGEQSRSRRVANKIRDARIEFLGAVLVGEYSREYKIRREREYPAFIPHVRFGYIGGVMLGMGRLSLSASGHDLNGSYIETNPAGSGSDNYRDPSNNSLSAPNTSWESSQTVTILYPYIGTWVSPYDWLWLELDLGYLYFSFDAGNSDLITDNGRSMVADNFSGGPQLQFKILFGNNPNVKVNIP